MVYHLVANSDISKGYFEINSFFGYFKFIKSIVY
ncbi:Uncharacterised protein [Bacteroides thetaiotaomicron]|uniref:Uncharacterized protein n=1 Tax=Bacteroides thetaiotaomicron TaxID=818 RepID=A0A174MJS9_BACT4|nr:Uncharacterised protein [Bacteroides thetaiotaomicron]